MRSVIFIALLVAVAMANNKPHYDLDNAPALFEKFIQDYNRHYKDEEDRRAHYEAFVESLQNINRLNAQDSGATFDINKLADYTAEERKHLFGYMSIKKD